MRYVELPIFIGRVGLIAAIRVVLIVPERKMALVVALLLIVFDAQHRFLIVLLPVPIVLPRSSHSLLSPTIKLARLEGEPPAVDTQTIVASLVEEARSVKALLAQLLKEPTKLPVK